MAKSRLSSGMKSFLKNRYIPLISRFILGIVFIYASLDKIIDPVSFSDNIDNYHVSPVAINNLVALILPWVELIIGLGLITGIFLKGEKNFEVKVYSFSYHKWHNPFDCRWWFLPSIKRIRDCTKTNSFKN